MDREALLHEIPPYLETANAVMAQAIRTARRAAEVDAPDLLRGESGTGKHVLAQAMHSWSGCRGGPFVALPCTAFAEHRHEGELFRCTEAAAGGGDERLETIRGGTLFCEEVSDLRLGQQAKLVRLLDESRFEEQGHVMWEGMRVIAASRRDLAAEVRAGRFLSELFVRLRVRITLPPLRDRPEDLPMLTEYLLGNLAQRYHRCALRLAPEVEEVFGRYRWPGNVRELAEILKRAVILSRDDVVTARDLPERLLQPAASTLVTGSV